MASEKHAEEKHLAPRNDRPVHPSWSQEGEGLTKRMTFALYPIILPKGTGVDAYQSVCVLDDFPYFQSLARQEHLFPTI